MNKILAILIAVVLLSYSWSYSVPSVVVTNNDVPHSGTSGSLIAPRFQLLTFHWANIVGVYRQGTINMFITGDAGANWFDSLNVGVFGDNHAHFSVTYGDTEDTVYMNDRYSGDSSRILMFGVTQSGFTSTYANQVIGYVNGPCGYTAASVVGSFWRIPNDPRIVAGVRGGTNCNFVYNLYSSSASFSSPYQGTIADESDIGEDMTRSGGITMGNYVYQSVWLRDSAFYLYKFDHTDTTWAKETTDNPLENNTNFRIFAINHRFDSTWIFTWFSTDQDTLYLTHRNKGTANWSAPIKIDSGSGAAAAVAATYIESSKRFVLMYSFEDGSGNDRIYMKYLDKDSSITQWSQTYTIKSDNNAFPSTYWMACAFRTPSTHGDKAYLAYQDATDNIMKLLTIDFVDPPPPRYWRAWK